MDARQTQQHTCLDILVCVVKCYCFLWVRELGILEFKSLTKSVSSLSLNFPPSPHRTNSFLSFGTQSYVTFISFPVTSTFDNSASLSQVFLLDVPIAFCKIFPYLLIVTIICLYPVIYHLRETNITYYLPKCCCTLYFMYDV